MDQTREELLRAWMSLSAYIRGNRLLRELSMNEMLVCNLLYRRQEEGGPPVTATELCARTQLLKSQVNHILTAMESRGLTGELSIFTCWKERSRSIAESTKLSWTSWRKFDPPWARSGHGSSQPLWTRLLPP